MLLVPALYVSVCGSAAVAVFYAFGETATPATIGLLGFLSSLIVKGVLFHYLGILGIAAGASVYLCINMAGYHLAVHRRIARASRQG
jgi:peptidoglycan biosynthesis protein MviN/MurJ (putative lipid II flippase)